MLTPGPDHPIRIAPATHKWRACFNGHVFADSDDAVILKEADLPPVVYFPRAHVAMEYTGRTDRQTHCPYKGDASYYTLTMDGDVAENVAWSYEHPAEAVREIAGMIAFYTDRVQVYEVTDPRVQPRRLDRSFAPATAPAPAREDARRDEARREDARVEQDRRAEVDEIIQHTDAGDGTSQREHWAPNVETPNTPEGRPR